MADTFLMQLLTLSLYVFFMGFCFCDGFNLHIIRKFIWFTVFLIVSISTLNIRDNFDLTLILPMPTLLAIILCSYEKIKERKKKK